MNRQTFAYFSNRRWRPATWRPLTMPDYESLAAQGIYALGNGGGVFAGQRDETFAIDFGAVFDTVNLRRNPFPLLEDLEDRTDSMNSFGNDALSGFNVNTIAFRSLQSPTTPMR